jgi:hypothetical protein
MKLVSRFTVETYFAAIQVTNTNLFSSFGQLSNDHVIRNRVVSLK